MRKTEPTQLEFRIIAGSLKGKKVVVPDLGVTRPPLTRLRKAIFDYLNPYLDDARYLDLFSGTGSYLFEAVSRGASAAVGVELEARLCESILAHARSFGVTKALRCRNEDVFTAIPASAEAGERFEVIMMAPPQYRGLIERTLVMLEKHPLLAEGGQIVCQHDTSETNKIDWGEAFELQQRRKYGNTTFTILGKKAVE